MKRWKRRRAPRSTALVSVSIQPLGRRVRASCGSCAWSAAETGATKDPTSAERLELFDHRVAYHIAKTGHRVTADQTYVSLITPRQP